MTELTWKPWANKLTLLSLYNSQIKSKLLKYLRRSWAQHIGPPLHLLFMFDQPHSRVTSFNLNRISGCLSDISLKEYIYPHHPSDLSTGFFQLGKLSSEYLSQMQKQNTEPRQAEKCWVGLQALCKKKILLTVLPPISFSVTCWPHSLLYSSSFSKLIPDTHSCLSPG